VAYSQTNPSAKEYYSGAQRHTKRLRPSCLLRCHQNGSNLIFIKNLIL